MTDTPRGVEPSGWLVALRWTVSGQVQGVGFRYSTLRQARQLGLVGRVRNLPSGAVEIDVAGAHQEVRRLEAWLRQGGPPGAVVSELREEPLAPALWDTFEIDR
jgi:acylphosphatase